MIYHENTDNWLLEDFATFNPFSVLGNDEKDICVSTENEETKSNSDEDEFLAKVSKKRRKKKTRNIRNISEKNLRRDNKGVRHPDAEVYRCQKCFYSHFPCIKFCKKHNKLKEKKIAVDRSEKKNVDDRLLKLVVEGINFLENKLCNEGLDKNCKRLRGGANTENNDLIHSVIVTRAIQSAQKHGINLVQGTLNQGNGNCAFDSIISNINDRKCFPEKLELSSTDYRQIWITEFEMDSHKYPNLGAGYSSKEIQDRWNKLKQSGVYEVEFFGDLVLHAIAKGCRKNILIFNTSLEAEDPIYVIQAEEFGGIADIDIPVVVAYNQVHYESMHPITQEDIEKTKLLMNSYIAGTYEYTKQDIPFLISRSRKEANLLKNKCRVNPIISYSETEFPPLPSKKQKVNDLGIQISQKLTGETDSLKMRFVELKSKKPKERSLSERQEMERLRKSIARASETEEKRKSRQEKDLKRHATARAAETPTEKIFRQGLDCMRHVHKKKSETSEEKKIRLEQNRKNQAYIRKTETLESKETRKEKDCKRHENRRESETPKEKKTRQEKDCKGRRKIRDSETIEEKNARQEQDRRSQAARRYVLSKKRHYIGWTGVGEKNPVLPMNIERMDRHCIDCGALMFPWEISKKKGDDYTFSLCCSYGTIKLEPFKDPPSKLKGLFLNQGKTERQFRENIRGYNGLVSMASKNITGAMTNFGCTRGPNIFKMSGQMYHLTPSHIFPDSTQQPKFSQIYVYDEINEIANRVRHANDKRQIHTDTLKIIQQELKGVNFLVQQFMSAADVFKANPEKPLKMVFKSKGSAGAKKKYMRPDISDVVVIAPGEQTEPRDVVLYRYKNDHPTKNDTTRIDENHVMYDPAAFPIILPYGDYGFSFDRELYKENKRKLTAMEFYRYHLQVRDHSFNTLQRAGRLGQEYLCDQYSKIEASRLKFLRNNQDQLRVELYSGLQDAIAKAKSEKSGESEETKLGQMIVLPSSYTGSPRWMYSHYLDALAIARKYQKFTLFITMTGNTKWPGITENIFDGQQPYDRPDIVNRVFQRMLGLLLEDLKNGALGPVKARLHTIEGQFRGLKHAHILLLLTINLTVTDIDQIISAQIPDPNEKPELYEVVKKYMLHGPCGTANPKSPCMENGKCSKGFPKSYQEQTVLPEGGHGYPLYARPDNGRTIEKNGFVFDNRWVVPYNEFLSVKFDCHINVEFIGSFLTIKYIYKYVHKGADVSTVAFGFTEDRDEITQFVNARTIDPYEAHWRIQGYKVQDRDPAVIKLAIHTEDQQSICFKEGNAEFALENSKATTLMAYFELNKTDIEAQSIKYQDIPEYYTWDTKNHQWNKRKKQSENQDRPRTIGRISNVLPIQGEKFYLRILLNHRTGATSFSDMKVLNGIAYTTYKEVCLEMGLLQDDGEWVISMEEVSKYGHPRQIRAMFAIILQYCQPTKPRALYEKFLSSMSDDFLNNKRKETGKQLNELDDMELEEVTHCVLREINHELGHMGSSISEFPDLPAPPPMTDTEEVARVLREEIFDKRKQQDIVNQLTPLMNQKQAAIYEAVQKALELSTGKSGKGIKHFS